MREKNPFVTTSHQANILRQKEREKERKREKIKSKIGKKE
jgi:hypothetical protein